MNFLVFGIGKLVDSVTDFQKIFLGGLRLIIYYLDTYVYGFIINLYSIFKWICSARIVDNSIMNELATRVGFILGLIMFFYISFDFIQILLDPDKISDKDKGPVNIIKKFIIVIVLLGTSRYIFDLMYNFQNLLLNDTDGKGSLIERLILPYDIETDNFGKAISAQFMSQFYHITDDENVDDLSKPYDDYDYNTCYDVAETLPKTIASSGDFTIGKECLNERYTTENGRKWYITFSPFSILVGIFLAWILIMYCISVGMRVVQLALLQIISPATIICYLSPNKENVFTKWLKLYISTYIDVFIRIAIIDFVVLLSGLILDSGMSNNFWTSSPGNVPVGMDRFWISVFMIMALLSFAKNFPELLKKLLPDKLTSGLSLGFSTKDRMGMAMVGGALVGGTVGAAGQAYNNAKNAKTVPGKIFGAIGGLAFGGTTGAGRGAVGSYNSKNLRDAITNASKNQSQVNMNKALRQAKGQSLWQAGLDKVSDTFGVGSGRTAIDTTIETYDNLNSLIDGEDIVKNYVAQREKANEAYSDAQREYDVTVSQYGEGSEQATEMKNRLNALADVYAKADARVSGAREAVWKANLEGKPVSDIELGEWKSSDGKVHSGEVERAITEVGVNGSIGAAMTNVHRIAGHKYATRSEFNKRRKELHTKAEKKFKNK